MPVRTTCQVCGVALFSPSEALTEAAMVERHRRYGRCRPDPSIDGAPLDGAQVERRAVIEEDGRPAGAVAVRRDGRLA
jgi:hypothetical protein